MPRDRTPPGDAVSARLAARATREPLQRRTLPGGGEVFSGPLATRALEALGARAMTVDRAIVVGEGFDPGQPESQALFAHERVHLERSGGKGSHLLRDAEEVAARAAERMVLQRATAPGEGPEPGEGASHAPAEAVEGESPTAAKGYQALLAEGLSEAEIIDRLATACADRLDEEERLRVDRGGHVKGSF
ncbi:MAG: DUF4157 domain-containing protein [Deltaproteobacteria bacterium]|nr:DUF4157 domain-containing protein [Deltaproteobacteria bacterium]